MKYGKLNVAHYCLRFYPHQWQIEGATYPNSHGNYRGTMIVCAATECREGVDLAIVLDQSNNLDPKNVQRELDFVFEFVLDAASLDAGNSRLALVTYAATAKVEFYLGNFTDRRRLLDAVTAFHE